MIGIVDYGMGNLASVSKAFAYIGAEAHVIRAPEEVKSCGHIVLPGVGAFGDAIDVLRRSGMAQAVTEAVSQGKFFLGICLGMQLMFEASSEGGYFEGLKLLPGRIARLDEEAPSGVVYGCKGLKIPHMGWNSLEISRRDPIYTGLPEEVFTYFDHAYCLRTNADIVSAVCEYGQTIIASVQYGHMFGLQFHPEKSGTVGLAMLQNFAKLKEVL